MRELAKQAMTTEAQKACYVIDHLVESLYGEPGSPLRRALILIDIAQTPGITQSELLEHHDITKSAMNREIDWLFNHGCIVRSNKVNDARAIGMEVHGYSLDALNAALDYAQGELKNLKIFIELLIKKLRLEKPTLRDAKIALALNERGEAEKSQVLDMLYGGAASTDNRAYNKLVDVGVIKE